MPGLSTGLEILAVPQKRPFMDLESYGVTEAVGHAEASGGEDLIRPAGYGGVQDTGGEHLFSGVVGLFHKGGHLLLLGFQRSFEEGQGNIGGIAFQPDPEVDDGRPRKVQGGVS